MKETIYVIVGAVGGCIAAIFGGWDSAIAVLIIFMAVDFATGLICAAMGRSEKTKSGKLVLKLRGSELFAAHAGVSCAAGASCGLFVLKTEHFCVFHESTPPFNLKFFRLLKLSQHSTE